MLSEPDVLIVTYGRIAVEALDAKEQLSLLGYSCGIVLLEKLKPYDETAKSIIPYLPRSGGLVLFLEEEIKAGGMGMMLSDEMNKQELLKGFSYRIMALYESFAIQERSESIFETAGVSASDIIKECKSFFEKDI